ncbi:hypothetical protein HO173_012488 [Letharia columbiana]|uniref:Uncharacterized protein n=1 Tax=Letharia columbiana TaxID=112416 RepID=A0A8H6CN45_9LECA|nr:uncharacterized protein HO173_012488 [Letharia columbiana]KAF6226589.1 hypothetical protein HO173_012488 [Letharia columbiana]
MDERIQSLYTGFITHIKQAIQIYAGTVFVGRLLFFLVQTFVKVNNNGEIMYLRRNKRSQAASRYSTL